MQFVKYKCGNCNTVFVTNSRCHHIDYCPVCKDTGVDLGESYCRLISGKKGYFPHFVEAFNATWFEDEELYHSTLLGWLNDSDEEFQLQKEDGILYISKMRQK